MTAGRVCLRPGSLYAALARLTGEGMVRIDGEEVVSGRLRRYFALTDLGAERLTACAAQLSRTSTAGRRQLSARTTDAAGASA